MKRKSEQILEKSGQPEIIVLHSDDGGSSHEPPVGVGGDPPYVDPPHDLVPPGGEPPPGGGAREGESGGGYYKYKFDRKAGEKPYINLESVRVLTEKGDATGYVSFIEYKVPRDRISSLQLWIGDAAGEPEIIIEGKNGGGILSSKSFDERAMVNPPKRNRKKRYKFPDRDVRVVKWAIVDETGAILSDPTMENATLAAETDDLYYFYISFAHE